MLTFPGICWFLGPSEGFWAMFSQVWLSSFKSSLVEGQKLWAFYPGSDNRVWLQQWERSNEGNSEEGWGVCFVSDCARAAWYFVISPFFPSTRHDKVDCGCIEPGCLQGSLTKLSVSREDITLVLMPCWVMSSWKVVPVDMSIGSPVSRQHPLQVVFSVVVLVVVLVVCVREGGRKERGCVYVRHSCGCWV